MLRAPELTKLETKSKPLTWLRPLSLADVGSGLVLLAVMTLLFYFLVYPVSVIVSKAFFVEGKFSLEYFRLLFSSETQLLPLFTSLQIGLATTLVCTLLSFPLALITSRFDFPAKSFLSGLLLVPMIMPPFVGAIGIQRIFARFGSVNSYLLSQGWISQPIEWLDGPNMFWAVVLLEALHLYPIMYLNLAAAFANIDPSMEEMAATLGVKRWRQYKDIIWPLARPGYFAGAIIVFIWALTDLGTPLLVGLHTTMPVRIFNLITDVNENPLGFALVFFVIVLTVTFFLASKLLLSGKKYQMLARGHVSSPIQPSKWQHRLYIYPLLLGVIGVALIPHASVLLTSVSDQWFMTILPEKYSLQYYRILAEQELPLIGLKNSFLLASLSTLVDVVLGLVIAYIVTRKLIPFAAGLDALVMIPLALPGIVLAFGYVVTYTDTFLDPLHNPIPLLIIAYSIRRLPYMVRSASAGLQQTSQSLEEAAATMGASRFHILRSITVPLVLANLIAGGLLCFSYAMLDVSDSLILAMKDRFYPLTKAIYTLYLEQGSGEFVASALGMIAMLIMALCIMGAAVILGKSMGELFRS